VVNPTGYHSGSGPCTAISPATPKNDAADRYSPEIAAAFQPGRTVREATRKSLVVRAIRTPNAPMAPAATVTSTIAISESVDEPRDVVSVSACKALIRGRAGR